MLHLPKSLKSAATKGASTYESVVVGITRAFMILGCIALVLVGGYVFWLNIFHDNAETVMQQQVSTMRGLIGAVMFMGG